MSGPETSPETGPILVINPNSNTAVTDGISAALDGFRRPGLPAIDCVTLAEGPFGVESQRDCDSVVLPLLRLIETRPEASAIVIACYSDPGLDAARAAGPAPVFGIQDSGVLTALARADLFGVIALSDAAVLRHRRYMRRMGVLDRLAGEVPVALSVADSHGAAAFERLAEAGARTVAAGAGAVVLGCAGMAGHRAGLEAQLGVPVIDPTQAAVAMALGAVVTG